MGNVDVINFPEALDLKIWRLVTIVCKAGEKMRDAIEECVFIVL